MQTKVRMDAENELSLLTAITEILDSTDDESLSPFDAIPDSELLTFPRERENSSVCCELFGTNYVGDGFPYFILDDLLNSGSPQQESPI